MKSALAIFSLAAIFLSPMVAVATSVSTPLGTTAGAISNAMEAYAENHEGRLPQSWKDLEGYVNFERLERALGRSIQDYVILLTNSQAFLEKPSGARLVAATAFPVNEDRRTSIGRYIVYQDTSGKFNYRWEPEESVQGAVTKSGGSLPPAAVFFEKPIKPLYPEYSIDLVEDAVSKGVVLEDAVDRVDQHVESIVKNGAKPVSNWDELVTASKPGDVPSGKRERGSERLSESPGAMDTPATSDDDAGWLSRVAIAAVVCAVLVLVIFGIKMLGSGKGSPED